MNRAPLESWSGAEAYEQWMGRWSRVVAIEFLAWLAQPPHGRWLDVGCGAGAVTSGILATCEPAAVTGIDAAAAYVAAAQESFPDPRVTFVVGSAQNLAEHARFDVAVAGLMINFLPPADQLRTMAAMRQATRSGGTVAAYVWDYAEGMEPLRRFWDAARAMEPGATAIDQGQRFPICQPKPLAALFNEAGLREVEVRAIEIPTKFRDFDDYWLPFLGGQGSAPGYLATLDPDRQARIGEHLRHTLPTEADGSITLSARAWAVRGRCP